MSSSIICPICGGALVHNIITHTESHDNDQFFIYQNVPALVCEECGEYLLNDDVVEKLEVMSLTATPIKEVKTPVFDFAQA